MHEETADKFSGTGIDISKDEREYLGSGIGEQEFLKDLYS